MLPSPFDLSHNIYARYHVLDGVRYVKSLQNSASGEEEERLLWDAQKRGGTASTVLVAEDHVGIRGVKFASSNTVLSGPGNMPTRVWWWNICRPGGIARIRAKLDVGRGANSVESG